MSSGPSNNPDKSVQPVLRSQSYPAPDPTPGGEAEAENYIALEVRQARTALQRTRIIGIVMLLLLGGELIFITARFSSSLQPLAAAEIADGMIMQQINDKGPDVADQLKQKIPAYIDQTPDYALQQLPKYRTDLESRLETQLSKSCQAGSQQLDQNLDKYLDAHKDQIKGMLTNGSDPTVAKSIGDDLRSQFNSYIEQKSVGGASIREQLDVSLVALQDTAKTMHRLATAKDLTPQERETRRALAILTQSVGKQ